jgi:hypothetical protein
MAGRVGAARAHAAPALFCFAATISFGTNGAEFWMIDLRI